MRFMLAFSFIVCPATYNFYVDFVFIFFSIYFFVCLLNFCSLILLINFLKNFYEPKKTIQIFRCYFLLFFSEYLPLLCDSNVYTCISHVVVTGVNF